MTTTLPAIHWVVQSNLIKPAVLDAICAALRADAISYELVYVIPFSDEVPELAGSGMQLVFYGSSTLLMNAANDPRYASTVFYDAERFSMERYLREWGTSMLNADAQITTFSEFAAGKYASDSAWFLRPDSDDKSFSGTVMTFDQIQAFATELHLSNNPNLQPATRIAVSRPRVIEKEWRHFIVNGQIVSSCRYMHHGDLDVSATDIPADLISFVTSSCETYTPHAIFVMDTALSEGRYSIIECNCFNGTGFYDHDIAAIIHTVNACLRQQ